MKKLRLVMFEECNRACPGCCNNDWDLKGLPKITDYSEYKLIMLTGGEPMLKPRLIVETCWDIRKQTDAPIILYTAKSRRAMDLIAMLNWVDGITLTLHEQYDVPAFAELQRMLKLLPLHKSLRLNVFSNVDITGVDTAGWNVVDNKEWIQGLHLPDDEVLMRLF